MQATYNPDQKTSFTPSHRREGKCWFHQYTIIDLDGEMFRNTAKIAVTARLYCTDSVWYCCLWVGAGDVHASGSGKAGGYGYCKKSAAAAAAIKNAGFSLSSRIDGVGEEAVREALLAIAEAVGIKRPALVEAYQ